MNPIKSFDINRIGLLIKKELFYQRKAPWIIIGAVFIMLLIFHLLMASEDPGSNDLPGNQVGFYIATLLVLGTVFTSTAFNELNNKSEAHHYLSIPASSLEKLISKWLVTGIIYVIAFNIFYWVFTLFSNGLTTWLFGESAGAWNPFAARNGMNGKSPFFMSQLYLALHTTYLAGAVYFRKYSYFKTAIAQSAISFAIMGIVALMGYMFFSSVMNGNIGSVQVTQTSGFLNSMESILPSIGKFFLWIVTPLWMLTYSYFKLKETEV